MISIRQQKHVLTGGPCVGKTTILEEIARQGYQITTESARQIIEEEQEKEKQLVGYSGIFPWTDYNGYHQKITDLQMRIESNHSDHDVLFMDRGLVDNIAYMDLRGIEPTPEYLKHCRSASYDTIFFLEQLPFYVQDKARTETKEEMEIVHNKIFEVYSRMNYNVVRVPFMDIKDRAEFIINLM